MAPAHDDGWISAFLDAQAAELGAANNTLLAYGRDLKDFSAWMTRHIKSFATAGKKEIENYLISCEAAGLARATRSWIRTGS